MGKILNLGLYFLLKNGVSFKTVYRESNHVKLDMNTSWNETSLPTLLSNCSLKNINNADEFSFFSMFTHLNPFNWNQKKCSRAKHTKIRITGWAAANADGEKLQMLFIGKAKNPRCVRDIQILPCR